MSIFLFVLGFVFGMVGKFGVDQYVQFQNNQKKTYLDMENILTNFRALEKMKELDAKK